MTNFEQLRDRYDTIIVGAGSAGCALATRLSEDSSRTVLLVEAGRHYGPMNKHPAALQQVHSQTFSLPGSPDSWPMMANLTEDVSYPITRGKVVGGSGAVNGGVFTRGHPTDFAAWVDAGNDEWSFAKVLPAYKRQEADLDFGDTDIHSASGPVPVSRADSENLMNVSSAFVESCVELGYAWDPDMNNPASTGIGLAPFNSVKGVRQHAGARYLEPVIARRNLTLVDRTLVHRVVFDGKRAVGIDAERDGVRQTIRGDEVVLCAGGINSPKLLMLSGVGPTDILQDLGIPVVHSSPGVGKNLMDHPLGKVTYTTDAFTPQAGLPLTEVTLNTNLDGTPAGNVTIRPSLYSYMNMLFGVLRGQSLADRVRAGGFVLRPMKTASALWGTSLSALRHDVAHRRDLSLGVSLGTEESVGELRIVSRDPLVSPQIDLRYLTGGSDLKRMRDAVRLAVDILEGPAFRPLKPVRSAPTDEHLSNDAALTSYVTDTIGTTYHSACTCRMGPEDDGTAVVDQYCRVYGVEGLRVVDLSVLPSLVSRAPNATAIMLGERVSEFMRH